MSASPNRPLVGILWMVASGLMFVATTATVKHIGDRLPAPQMSFLRYLMGLVFVLPGLLTLIRKPPSGQMLKLYSARGVAHAMGVMCWFYAMTQITITEVTAMNYMTPIYVTIGAALFFGERLAVRRIAAITFAFIGALIILRPGFRELSPGHLSMIVAALMLGASYLIAKRLTDDASPGAIVAAMSITVTIVLFPLALAVWVPPTWTEIGWLFLVAVFATSGHYAMTLSFAAAPLTVSQPATFLQLLWATILGAVVFSEPLDPWVILGGLVIFVSVCFITWREHVLRIQAKTPPATTD